LTITTSDALQRDFLPLRQWHGACCHYPPLVFGAALVVEKQAWIGKGLKAKGLVKGWGHLRFYL
jgi:hypothetical protein